MNNKKAEPLASVIIPVSVQRDKWLGVCVLSALQQTAPCAVFVVISPRTPRSNIELLNETKKSYEHLEVLNEGPGAGFAAAINTGIRTASAARVEYSFPTIGWTRRPSRSA